jgi:Holliday junction DNA helicase RuvA
MIATIQGEILALTDDSLVVQVGGIGVRVFAPKPLLAQCRAGEVIFMHTHLVVREDALTLYGFEMEQERDLFNLLLGVNGVGPRIALTILSSMSVDAIRRAVISEQSELFSRVPGVGKKTAQKIVLYLQGKVGEAIPVPGSPTLEVDTEVIEALTSLGYSIVEAQSALQSIPRDAAQDLETRLKLALQYFTS